jgi:amino acid permease
VLTAANVAKLYVGIAFISSSKSIQQAGIYGSVVGFIYVLAINLYCTWLLIKARNRFKKDQIVDICDLTAVMFGEKYRLGMSIFLSINNGLFLVAYLVFFGTQIDQLMCKTFKSTECGFTKSWSTITAILIIPICVQKRLHNIGIFSAIINGFTCAAIFIIVYITWNIYQMPV